MRCIDWRVVEEIVQKYLVPNKFNIGNNSERGLSYIIEFQSFAVVYGSETRNSINSG